MFSTLRRKVCAAQFGLLLSLSWAVSSAAHPSQQATVRAQTSSTAPPDTIVVDSPRALLDLIEQQNPALTAARLNARSLRAEADAVQTLPDPTAGITVLPLPIHTARGEQLFQLRAEQMIPWPGKTSLDRSLAEFTADASGAESDELSLEIRSRALGRVVDLGRIEAIESTIHEYSRRLEDLERVAAVRYEVGQGPQAAIVKSQVERTDLDVRLASLRSGYSAAIADLAAATGTPVRIGFDPASARIQSTTAASGLSADSLLAIAVEERPAFERVRILERRSDAAVDRARLNLRPDFGVGMTWFSIMESDIPPSSDGRDALGIGVSIRIPLHRERKRSSIERAQLSALRTDETMRDLVARTRASIERQLAEIRSASEQLDLFRTALIPRAELSVATSLRAYESGGATYLDLLDAERTLFRLRLTRIETQTRLQHHVLRLEQLIGRSLTTY